MQLINKFNLDRVPNAFDIELASESLRQLEIKSSNHCLFCILFQALEVELFRSARGDHVNPFRWQQSVVLEVLPNLIQHFVTRHIAILLRVANFKIDFCAESKERNCVPSQLVHQLEVVLGETPRRRDYNKIKVLDAHVTNVCGKRELWGSGTRKIKESHPLAIYVDIVWGGLQGGLLHTNGGGTVVTRAKSTHGICKGRLSGSGVPSNGKVPSSLVACCLEPLWEWVRVATDVPGKAYGLHDELN
mmetsp:Transcript_215/g.592  ORF Transcript_215/g.592 Transcript_215/m.592 type:complete len:246 (+) Transcript_215:301-1038(+)